MNHQLPEPQCSVCGSRQSETFQRPGITGRRCLQCGHEQVVRIAQNQSTTPAMWSSNNTLRQF